MISEQLFAVYLIILADAISVLLRI